MKKSFEEYFKSDRRIIDRALLGHLNKERSASGEILEAMKYALFPGGKRLRPILCLEASRACGGKIKDAVPAACAIEFIHNFSLIHDDLPSMDDDDYRRGKPAVHIKFGEGLAVLSGDALLNLAFMALSDMKDSFNFKRICRIISSSVGLNGMIGGQALDIKYAERKKNPMESKINNLKTAAFFEASLASGAVSASASSSEIKAVSVFGTLFGQAFQICDDILDKKYKRDNLNAKKTQFRKLLAQAGKKIDIFKSQADNLRFIIDKLESKIF